VTACTAVRSSTYSYQYAYNGLGDNLQSTLNGETTTYTLDLNDTLTQVLSDGTNTYTYGYNRIAQVGSESTGYFLGDALGRRKASTVLCALERRLRVG
jgi:hypothetical protein